MGNIMSIVLQGSTSGSVTLQEPAVAGTTVLTLPAVSGTVITTGSSAVVTQAMLATGVAGTGPAFSAYQSSAQTLSSTTYTKINFQTEEWDTANCFDSTTNMRFTPNVAGYYQLNGGVSLNSFTAGVIINFYKNGTSNKIVYFNSFGGFSSSNGGFGSAIIYFNGSTDYVEMYAYISAGQPLSTGENLTYFQGTLIRTA